MWIDWGPRGRRLLGWQWGLERHSAGPYSAVMGSQVQHPRVVASRDKGHLRQLLKVVLKKVVRDHGIKCDYGHRGSLENSQCREPKETPLGWRPEHGVGQGLDPARPGGFLRGTVEYAKHCWRNDMGLLWADIQEHHFSELVMIL